VLLEWFVAADEAAAANGWTDKLASPQRHWQALLSTAGSPWSSADPSHERKKLQRRVVGARMSWNRATRRMLDGTIETIITWSDGQTRWSSDPQNSPRCNVALATDDTVRGVAASGMC